MYFSSTSRHKSNLENVRNHLSIFLWPHQHHSALFNSATNGTVTTDNLLLRACANAWLSAMDYSFFALGPQPPFWYFSRPPTPAHTHSDASEAFRNSPPVDTFLKMPLFLPSCLSPRLPAHTAFSRTLLNSSPSLTPTPNLRLAKAYPESPHQYQTTNSLLTILMPTAYRLIIGRTISLNQQKRMHSIATVTIIAATWLLHTLAARLKTVQRKHKLFSTLPIWLQACNQFQPDQINPCLPYLSSCYHAVTKFRIILLINHGSQRAFRERKEHRLKELEAKLATFQKDAAVYSEENERLKRDLQKAATENETLRATLCVNSRSFLTDHIPQSTGPLNYTPRNFHTELFNFHESKFPSRYIVTNEETSERLLTASAAWDCMIRHPLYEKDLVDIGFVSERLKYKAKWDGPGPVFQESDLIQAIESSVTTGATSRRQEVAWSNDWDAKKWKQLGR